jgi:membrane protein required for colicin V production
LSPVFGNGLIDEHAGLVFVAAVLGSLLLGAWRGLVYEVLSCWAGWWLCGRAHLGARGGGVAAVDGWDMQLRYAAGFVLLLVGHVCLGAVISWLSKQLIEAVGLRPVDRTWAHCSVSCAVACCCWCWRW